MSDHTVSNGEKQKPQTKALWRVFWILLALTAVEFAIAFGLDTDTFKWTKIIIFIIMTIVKAYFIVGNFMHLRDEVKSLIWTVILPAMFVVWLLVALIVEGGYIGLVR
ncbi:cytochrome C oxidase subunit IV family protein [Lacihabitans lacunae]|jgi:cytochrome c oxidase subunit IV|uniref:Cytochrome C oxidase subunit IV family protein n=1 Tax=Lacihabitans lacunae TaxID=1028214 RepID=A0ABV7Z1E9_9BACT